MNILHITDLHITDPKNTEEILREVFYPEYFEPLIEKINSDQKNIDFIFITGDIVNEAKFENYDHAFNVLKHLSEQLNVSISNIYVINGNHDVNRLTGSLKEFEGFSEYFNVNKNILVKENRFKLYGIQDNNAVLCLDSIGPSFSNGFPSSLDSAAKDSIVSEVRKRKFNNLFILSHHPAASYETQNQAPFDEADPSWSEKHIWSDGGNLYKRLSSRVTINGLAFWFAGDVHRNEYAIIDGVRVLSVVNSLNITSKSNPSKPPEVRVVSVNNHNTSQVYYYSFSGHNQTGFEGTWESKEVSAYPIGHDNQNKTKQKENAASVELNKIAPISVSSSKMSLICKELEKQIHDEIINKRIYEFGRFDTNNEFTSLSWVSTQVLLGDYPFFLKIINSFKRKINELIPQEIHQKECILIGIDLWGAILSSRLGATTNIPNCCIAVRSQRDSYDNVERINEALKSIVKGKKIIFVISDVISTGYSISTTYEKLKGADNSSWYNLAILCDPTQSRTSHFEDYTGTYYLCGSVKMPIVENYKLPNIDMLSANISFLK